MSISIDEQINNIHMGIIKTGSKKNKGSNELSFLTVDKTIWSMFHLKGRNPGQCTCLDCSDNGYCSKNLSPVECAEKTQMVVSFGF